MKTFVTIFICLIILSCEKKDKLNHSDIVGAYVNGTDSTNYNDLLLRPDSTYIGHQSPQWGDLHYEFAGQWRIIDDTIVLFKGKDFGDQLEIKNQNEIKSDSLTLDVNELLRYNENIRLSLNNIDFKIMNGKIRIYKPDYWEENPFNNEDGFLPGNIDLRLKNGFARIHYFYTDKDMVISFIDNSKVNLSTDTILCKYYMQDSILYSTNEFYQIEKHNLRINKLRE